MKQIKKSVSGKNVESRAVANYRLTAVSLLFLLFSSGAISLAQRVEPGIFLGFSNYLGDLSPVGFTVRESKPAAGLLVRINTGKWTSIRWNLFHGTISGDDKNQKDEVVKTRGLHFRSPVTEFSGIVEFNIVRFRIYRDRTLVPYFLAGAGIYRFNPRGMYEGEERELQPLRMEGQQRGGEYNLTEISFPLGAGVKYQLTDNWNLGVEMGLRKTFTDYLDDISLRGDPDDLDWYLFAGITLTYSSLFSNTLKIRDKGGKARASRCYKFNKNGRFYTKEY